MKAALSLLSVFLILVTFSCGGKKEVLKPPPKNWQYHVIQKGETLYSIAQRYGTTVEKLRRVNRISDPAKIKTGQRILVPRKSKKAKAKPSKKEKLSKKDIKKLIWPLNGTLTSKFGIRNTRRHDGIDVAAPKGTPIRSAAAGKVIFSGWGPGGYGRMIIVKHSKRMLTVYAHNELNLVKKNQKVRKGKIIGKVGRSGKATGNHLHFEVRIDRKPRDPLKYLPKKK